MTTYTVTLRNTTPEQAGAALANMVKTRADAKRYLDDVNDSAPGYAPDYLIELTAEAYALTEPEAKDIYREWRAEVE